MALDIAMGGSTNTVLHILAIAHEGGVDFTMDDIDALSRKVPNLCKVAPAKTDVHIEDVHRAGGISRILGQLDRAGLINRDEPHRPRRHHGRGARPAGHLTAPIRESVRKFFMAAPGGVRTTEAFSPEPTARPNSTSTARTAASATPSTPSARMAAWPCSTAISPSTAAS